jgi:hypothetical protein
VSADTFEVTVTKVHEFKEGWGVYVEPIYGFSDEEQERGEYVADIEVAVVRIDREHTSVVGDVPCVHSESWPSNFFVPVNLFREVPDLTEDDTHDLRLRDLRLRWFATREEADEHAKYTMTRWQNPSPWESFVATK